MKRFLLMLLLTPLVLFVVPEIFAAGSPTVCSGDLASFGYEKQLLPLPGECPTGMCGRYESCEAPKRIVMHTTWGITSAQGIYDYFASGSGGRGVGCHFVIGQDGKVIQMLEMLTSTVERAVCTGGYTDHISIEMGSPSGNGDYANKGAMNPEQYQAALILVKQLMQQYSIPLGALDADWRSHTDSYTDSATTGLYGHYQLNPSNRTDPGSGWFADFRADIAADPSAPTGPNQPSGGGGGVGTGTTFARSNCVRTAVGDAPSPTFPPECENVSSGGGGGGGSDTPGGPRPTAPPCPNNDCRQAVIDEFNVTISTAHPGGYAQYAWEKLWDVSNTNFDELVDGTFVERDDSGSHRVGNTIYLRSSYDQAFFDIIFIHEMGHVINDLPDPQSFRTPHRDVWKNDTHEGRRGVTGYGETACLYGAGANEDAKIEEDYAEMLAYYLNPGVPENTTSGCNRGVVPYADGKYKGHFDLAYQILGAY